MIHPAALLEWPARTFPNKTAIVFRHDRLTFAEVDARINRLANSLLSLGLPHNSRVAVLADNTPQAVEVRFALMKAGLCMVPLNTRQSAAEQAAVIDHAGALVLIGGRGYGGRIVQLQAVCGDLKWVIASDGEATRVDYESFVGAGGTTAPAVSIAPTDLERIAYTSGTTGTPRGVIRSFENADARLRNDFLNEDRVVDESEIFLNAAPLTHAARNHLHKHYVTGGTNVIVDRFEPEVVLELIERERVTGMMLVPTMLIRIVQSGLVARYDIRTLRLISIGTAPISPRELDRAIEAFGPIIRQTYGLTEASQPILMLHPAAWSAVDVETRARRLRSAGRPALGVETRIVDATGREVPWGETGELIIRGDVVTPGYWNDPAATAEVIVDGWLHTGDLARTDADGYVTIVDRLKDIVISGGFNIAPREVEQVLETHPAVKEAGVVGVPDPEWGERLVAFVVLQAGTTATAEELVRHCQERIGSYKKPRAVLFAPALPRNIQGKIVKHELRQRAAAAGLGG